MKISISKTYKVTVFDKNGNYINTIYGSFTSCKDIAFSVFYKVEDYLHDYIDIISVRCEDDNITEWYKPYKHNYSLKKI